MLLNILAYPLTPVKISETSREVDLYKDFSHSVGITVKPEDPLVEPVVVAKNVNCRCFELYFVIIIVNY